MDKLQIEYVPIEEVKPYGGNVKTHPAEQIEQIKKSIQKFGMCDPLGIWHGEVVEGHGRLIACTELGIDTIPIIRLDNLTDKERRAYALAHNKLTMNSGFDYDLLTLELSDLVDLDMGDFGFVMDDIDGNFDDPAPVPQEKEPEKEEIHEVTVTCNTKSEFDGLMKYINKNGLIYQEI